MQLYLLILSFYFISIPPLHQDQEVRVIKYPELLTMMEECHGEVVVYNFWATWCAPCIKEMPHFESINRDEQVTVKFISLDDVDLLESKVKPFLEKKQIQSEVYLLDETDYNAFIDKVDRRWSGAIPATVIFDCSTGDKLFYEQAFEENQLHEIVRNLK